MLEIGCGTGRNFPYLRRQVGPTGMVYGVDLSAGMLRRRLKAQFSAVKTTKIIWQNLPPAFAYVCYR